MMATTKVRIQPLVLASKWMGRCIGGPMKGCMVAPQRRL